LYYADEANSSFSQFVEEVLKKKKRILALGGYWHWVDTGTGWILALGGYWQWADTGTGWILALGGYWHWVSTQKRVTSQQLSDKSKSPGQKTSVLTGNVHGRRLAANLPSAGPSDALTLKLVFAEIFLHLVTRNINRGFNVPYSRLGVHKVLLHWWRVG
jgi:hypothetical protein